MGAKQKILFVDDDPEILAALRRRLRRKYVVDTALGPIRALEAVIERGPYAVIVSDLRMPAMDGMEFLGRLRKTCPDTVRVMLTGHADLKTAMDAVNTDQVFRFLAKPCAEEDLDEALAASVAQYLQASAEKEFLKGALRGIIKVLTDLLALLNAEALGRATRVKRLVADMARYCDAPDVWRIELAVMLSQLGAMVMPEAMFASLRAEGTLDGDRERLFARHPAIGADLLVNIPKLGEVADIIRHQETPYAGDGSGGPAGPEIPLGARLLKAAFDFDRLLTSGTGRDEALAVMAGRQGLYDPRALEVLGLLAGSREGYCRGEASVSALTAGMVLEEDICLGTGEKAAVAGQVVDPGLIERLQGLGIGRKTPVRVLTPTSEEAQSGMADPELLALLRRVRSCPTGR
ncbi:response regulator receiver protein [Solidesulfovibrio carbinoliphilus subsp. oakridgensis]|uniref:Response regulator receiver protein n=1 Tax=Solidesulfovibrio carbinoliphilus subsp. oakridgensis TaxID=694327 RepID=G7Q784_9BACT|nr:HD domain-containing phosphohydrolase [Solidesulfovibrio carbinoliphilus]EHJ49041.1 response regulator receiver protein [Solidesulfovibrio carbinoliphilus subsp. oakridgensis]